MTSDASIIEETGLVGTWTYRGTVPQAVTLTISIHADETFQFVEEKAPLTTPAGHHGEPCVTTDTYVGTYARGDGNSLTWNVQSGTANAVSECGANDSAGTPMTQEGVTAYRAQGLIPPAVVTYELSATELVLTPGLGPEGSRGSTSFTRSVRSR